MGCPLLHRKLKGPLDNNELIEQFLRGVCRLSPPYHERGAL